MKIRTASFLIGYFIYRKKGPSFMPSSSPNSWVPRTDYRTDSYISLTGNCIPSWLSIPISCNKHYKIILSNYITYRLQNHISILLTINISISIDTTFTPSIQNFHKGFRDPNDPEKCKLCGHANLMHVLSQI